LSGPHSSGGPDGRDGPGAPDAGVASTRRRAARAHLVALPRGARSTAPVPAEGLWRTLLEGLPQAAWLARLDNGLVVAANSLADTWFGDLSGGLLGRSADLVIASPEDLAWWMGAAAGDHSAILSDTVVAVAGGGVRHVSRSIRVVQLPDAQGQPVPHALVTAEDRSAAMQMEAQREELLAELQGTLEATADGILVTDLAGRVRAFNRRFAELFALPPELLSARDDDALQRCVVSRLAEPGGDGPRLLALPALPTLPPGHAVAPLHPPAERFRLANGTVLERVARPLVREAQASGCVWSFRDLTERLAAEQRIEVLSGTDALTGLANRSRLVQHLERLLAAEDSVLALLVVDLDHFRHINDTLGLAVGNEVLLDVARRIQGCLRRDDLLARVGGDQFAVVVSHADRHSAEKTAKRVGNVVKKTSSWNGAQFTLTCSIGVALAPSHGRDADGLLRQAEAAMRMVKTAGRAHWRVHERRQTVDRRAQLELDHAMRQALAHGRFRLQYQPQVDLASGRVTGAEALLRWRDPTLGEVSPARFIPVAEETGFIVDIGDWVLKQAVRQARLWHAQGLHLPVAVNVSALQFHQADFVDHVADSLALADIPPSLLEIELTERIMFQDDEAEVLARLQALARLGVMVSLDDFGTGYSSLAYLKRCPIDKLKIDKSFVRGLPDDDSNAAIVRAIVQMARALGKRVLAEGVETEAQRQFLQEAGCDEFQGWLHAPALDPADFERRLGVDAAPSPPPQAAAPRRRIRLVSG
jgi:diguanylate cyclase (GGDEF)-like protein